MPKLTDGPTPLVISLPLQKGSKYWNITRKKKINHFSTNVEMVYICEVIRQTKGMGESFLVWKFLFANPNRILIKYKSISNKS